MSSTEEGKSQCNPGCQRRQTAQRQSRVQTCLGTARAHGAEEDSRARETRLSTAGDGRVMALPSRPRSTGSLTGARPLFWRPLPPGIQSVPSWPSGTRHGTGVRLWISCLLTSRSRLQYVLTPFRPRACVSLPSLHNGGQCSRGN